MVETPSPSLNAIVQPKLKTYNVTIEVKVQAESKKAIKQIFDSILFSNSNIDNYIIDIDEVKDN
jgi:phosphoribosylformylglycinamidine (FGAM) synthase PurS component